VAILLTYCTDHLLLTGDAQAREEEYMVGVSFTRP
jgi:beta-lactamase superfamily II metal-dependent hydrolase